MINHMLAQNWLVVSTHLRRNPEKGKEAAAPSNIKEIQEIQGGQEAPHKTG